MAVRTVTYVFVYGTLKSGHGNHYNLGRSSLVGEAITNEDTFGMYDGGFPFVVDNADDTETQGRIVGELYQVISDVILENLDRLEGVPTLYVKREIDVTTLDNIPYKATVYVASNGSRNRMKNNTPMKPKGRAKLLEWRA